ncbi:type I secretion system permease/ATPase [Marinomonas ostreistagni]|uniref:type I secretion system permease/ATPase n=1 Tax=Marinomonas ostreistagni TaxID=359209 RepID=UPI00194F89F1|nr:type I secretion system permease/ATPase [Marinomonas ostreistagni]MBM6550447.1 type I secretion system permease/ATPase [Marinomonas ostreistagni]
MAANNSSEHSLKQEESDYDTDRNDELAQTEPAEDDNTASDAASTDDANAAATESASRPKNSKWHKSVEELETPDPLLDCLVSLTKYFDNPYTHQGVSVGLPLSQSGMTPELFQRAAQRIGLVTRFVKRPLDKISSALLPVVLLLENDQACVMLEVDEQEQQVKVFLPETGDGETWLAWENIAELYTGYCFFIRPQYRFDKRAQSTKDEKVNDRHWFWGTVATSWRIYRDVFIASLLINIFALASPLFVMNVYDRVVPNNAFDTLWVLAIGVTIVYFFDFLLRTLRAYFIDVAGKKSDILLSANIFAKVNNIRMASRPKSVGAFAKNLQEFDSIREFITSASITTLVDIPFMFLIVGVIWLIGGPMGVIPLITIALVLIYSLVIQAPLRNSIEEGQKTSLQKNAVLIESLSNAESVKLNNAQGTLQQHWESAVGNIADWGLKTRQLAQSCSSFAMTAQQMTSVAMVIVGVYLISEGEMSMGALIASVMLTGRALAPMAQFAALASRYNYAKSAFKALNEIMASPVEQPEDTKFVHRSRFDGRFEFDNVSFSYPEEEQDAVAALNLSIKAGEKVAIIGRIGSGKSTLGKLMTGLYEPREGAVRIDGIDLRQVNPVDLRRSIGVVSQDVSLFYGSIKENICFGVPYIEDEAIIRAADLSGVSEFANHRPSGLDSIVGERGLQLSGGQRQSVAIARALLFDPQIMILDEPTASMDNTTEVRMKRRLANIIADKTLILITHKSSMLDLVDRIIVMDNSRIVADGPKEQVFEALRQGKLKVS